MLKKILVLSGIILCIIFLVFAITYGYWQEDELQPQKNKITSSCLNLTYEDESPAINLNGAWPITDEESALLTGYSFSVTNECQKEIIYSVGLDSITDDEYEYLNEDNVKISLDNSFVQTFASLHTNEVRTSETVSSKDISFFVIPADFTYHHTIRMWIKSDAPVEEQGKAFQASAFINAGSWTYSFATDSSNFQFDSATGTLTRVTGFNRYDDSINELVIPKQINGVDVTSIAGGVFRGKDLANAIIPNTVSTIGETAFYANRDIILATGGIPTIYIPDSVTSIGLRSFSANNIRNLYISKNIVDIPEAAFSNNKLEEIILPEQLQTIGDRAFYNNLLTEVVIPANVTSIGIDAFSYNPNLTTITVKRASAEGMTLGENWHGIANVIFDPS